MNRYKRYPITIKRGRYAKKLLSELENSPENQSLITMLMVCQQLEQCEIPYSLLTEYFSVPIGKNAIDLEYLVPVRANYVVVDESMRIPLHNSFVLDDPSENGKDGNTIYVSRERKNDILACLKELARRMTAKLNQCGMMYIKHLEKLLSLFVNYNITDNKLLYKMSLEIGAHYFRQNSLEKAEQRFQQAVGFAARFHDVERYVCLKDVHHRLSQLHGKISEQHDVALTNLKEQEANDQTIMVLNENEKAPSGGLSVSGLVRNHRKKIFGACCVTGLLYFALRNTEMNPLKSYELMSNFSPIPGKK